MKKLRRNIFAVVVAVSFLMLCSPAAIAEYPEKPITMYCVFTAGGPMDTITRALCSGAEKILGQPIKVVNKPGAGGTVGLGVLAGDKPDGYTLCSASSTGIMRIPLRRRVPFKPLASFTNILGYMHPSAGIQVRPDSKFKEFQDIIDFARKNPGKFKYATSGTGTPHHIAMLIIQKKEGVKFTQIPFDGSSEEFTAVLGGHVDMTLTGIMYSVKGQLRPLAMSTFKRLKQFPDVPTLIDLGYDYYNDSYFGIFGPAGIDPVQVAKLEKVFAKAMDTEAVQRVVDNTAMIPRIMGSKDYTKFLEDGWVAEIARLKDAGLLKKVATQPR